MDMPAPRQSVVDALERELKFAIAPTAIEGLKRHPLLALAQRDESQLVSTYYDTTERALKKAGLSLRLRTSGDHIIQTLKRTLSASSGLHARKEDEIERTVFEPDLEHVRRHIPARLRSKLAEPLQPVFFIEVKRTTWPVRWLNSNVLVSLDDGCIRVDEKSEPIHEVEIELRDGDTKALFAVARQLVKSAPLRIEVATKPDRGYLLLDDKVSTGEKATPIRLDPRSTAAVAFQAMVSACIRHFASNQAMFLDRHSAETVHQMRVAIRRLRSLVEFYKEKLPKPVRRKLKAETKRVFQKLGRARDIDVALLAFEEDSGDRLPSAALFNLHRQHRAAYKDVVSMLTSRHFCLQMIDLLAFVTFGSLSTAAPQTRRTNEHHGPRDEAAEILHRQWNKLVKFERVSRLSDGRRHRLRLRAKTFRYASEFFADLFSSAKGNRRRNALLETLRLLLDNLGMLNDRVATHKLLDGVPIGTHPSKNEVSKDELLRAADTAQRHLHHQRPFWSKIHEQSSRPRSGKLPLRFLGLVRSAPL
jgi:triphosphatase